MPNCAWTEKYHCSYKKVEIKLVSLAFLPVNCKSIKNHTTIMIKFITFFN